MIREAELIPPDDLCHLVVTEQPDMTAQQSDIVSYSPDDKEIKLGERYVISVGEQIYIVKAELSEGKTCLIDFYSGHRMENMPACNIKGQITRMGRETRY